MVVSVYDGGVAATDVAGSRGVACDARALSARAAFAAWTFARSRTSPSPTRHVTPPSQRGRRGIGIPSWVLERRRKAPPKQPVDTARANVSCLP